MSDLVLDDLSVEGSTLRYRYTATGDLRRFLTGEDLLVEYDVDVSDVPEHLLVVPWLANAAPVAWACGADVAVPVVGERFRDSLLDVQRTLASMYPAVIDGGDIRYRELADDPRERDDRSGERSDDSGLLFSGGVDSLASYLRHREEDPLLLSIHGWDITLDQPEAWERRRNEVRAFASERGHRTRFVRSNVLSMLDTTMLLAHFRRYLDEDWYTAVGHGLGMLGLCAPVADREGLGRLYIAATHAEGFSRPWGSHPDVDERVAWAGTAVTHDCYDLTRQEKLNRIADYVRAEYPDLQIHSCYQDETGGNCLRCEKCARTAAGLVLADLDPADHGYDVDAGTFARARERLETGEWSLGADEQFMWEDLQDHVDPDADYPSEAEPFLRWLADADVAELVARSSTPLGHRAVRAVARNTPYAVYSSLYPLSASIWRVVASR